MLKNKKGSVTILILLMFLSLISCVMIFIDASREQAVKSNTKEMSLVWCESILGEYDLNLQGRYGIFAFEGIEKDINEKLDFYAGKSFFNKKYIKYEGANCSLYNYSLRNLPCFKKQIVKEGKYAALNKNRGIREIKAASNAKTLSPDKVDFTDLPSSNSNTFIDIKSSFETVKKLSSIKDLIKKGTDKYFERKYVEKYFKNDLEDKKLGRTYFNLEEEYILNGKLSDEKNRKSTKRKIIIIRSIMNLVYLQTDGKKQAETLAAAEILTPGPWAAATQKAIQAAWSLAEARNDYIILLKGGKVPFCKTDNSWATDLKSILKSAMKKKPDAKTSHSAEKKALEKTDFHTELPYVHVNNDSGENYADYLSAMIFLMKDDIKLNRMMDLIEINMQTMYYGGFRLKNYSTGLHAKFKVNGGEHFVKKEYTPKRE